MSESSDPLRVLNQTSLAVEKYARNGVQKSVHVVVKNTPFSIQVALNHPNKKYSLNCLTLEAALLYDCDELKEVDFVRLKPLEYKCHINDQGNQCAVETRIKVLSSQLEDMFFRIRFRAVDTLTKAPVSGLEALSEPIKVISKPDQLKEKAPKAKKRTVSDLLVDTLNRIESQQAEHRKLLAKLCEKTLEQQTVEKQQQQQQQQQVSLPQIQPLPPPLAPRIDVSLEKPSKPLEDFEAAFHGLISAYNHLKPEERAIKIRKVVRNTPSRDVDNLSELIDLFWAEGLQRDYRKESPVSSSTPLPSPPSSSCSNGYSSPSFINSPSSTTIPSSGLMICGQTIGELAQLDDFYRELLYAPLFSSSDTLV